MNRLNPINESREGETQLMERCVERENMLKAWKRVKQNGGTPGIDGRTIEETAKDLKVRWLEIRRELLEGRYQPEPVKKVEIEKHGGGMRQLGIPTVIDRLIQQCILQILQPMWDPTFHPDSYGFRPGRSAHLALRRAQELIQEDRHYVVDVDLEKFFDRVNHDILMDRVMKRVKDPRLVKLIRRYLQAGIMVHGVTIEREEGTPQGGPLSPLLSNLLLDEVDWELERRGISFVRYADDCNAYVKSQRAAERVMQAMEKIMGKLKLKINKEKSAAGEVWGRKFLGYRFLLGRDNGARLGVAEQSLKRFKGKVKQHTRRRRGESIEKVVVKLNRYLEGWGTYFQLISYQSTFKELDKWIRRRLRSMQLHQWKRGKTCYRELVMRGLPPKDAAQVAKYCRSPWKAAMIPGMHQVFTLSYYSETLGLISLAN